MRRRSLLVVLVLVGCAGRRAAAPVQPPGFEDFTLRVNRYAELHRDLKEKLPDLKDKSEPERILAVEQGLAAALRKARAGAKPGDIFSPAVRPLVLAAVRKETKGPANKPASLAVDVGNPRTGETKVPVQLKVNGPYGKAAPLSIVPPSVLKRLPPLPPELEYRFVGKHLILRDTVANLIVDYMTDVAL